MTFFYPIKCQCCTHIETIQLICCTNQLTDFYMRATLALNGANLINSKTNGTSFRGFHWKAILKSYIRNDSYRNMSGDTL